MKAPRRRKPLIEEGLIDSVVRQLMSGKEAAVDVVRCGEETRCAKVCKCGSSKLEPDFDQLALAARTCQYG